MYNRLKKLYDTKRLTKEMLAFYVTNGILTQEQYDAIVKNKVEGGEYAENRNANSIFK